MSNKAFKVTISFTVTNLIDHESLAEWESAFDMIKQTFIEAGSVASLPDLLDYMVEGINLESVEEIPQIKTPAPCNICDGHGTYFQGEREIACFGCDDRGNPKIIEVVHKKKVVFRGLSNHIDVKKAIAENYLIRAAKEVKNNA